MINAQGQRLIRESEGCRLTAYRCVAGVPTIGYGRTTGVTEADVDNKLTITQEQAEAMLREDLDRWERDVKACLTREPNENQLAAMVSLAYNIGVAAFKKSSVCKAFNTGDDTSAARAFGMWSKITDPKTKQLVPNSGLVARRARETALFLRPTMDEEKTQALAPVPPMPQAVAEPVSLAASNINKSAIIGGASAAVAGATQVIDTVNSFKTSVTSLGNWLLPILCLVVVLAAGWTIYERVKLRKTGVL